MAERVVVVCDDCGQQAKASVTFRIGNRSLAKDLCVDHLQDLTRNAHAPRRGRRPASLSAAGPKANSGPVRSKRTGSRKGSSAKRPRKRITDPATLEKRRAALAKARQALAAKRAAASKAG